MSWNTVPDIRSSVPLIKSGSMRADAEKNYGHILAIARDLLGKGGTEASLRDIARTAGVGLGTLYRHFPSREALLEALLRANFDKLAARARELESSHSAGVALVSWLREIVTVAHNYSGAIQSMVSAIDDEASALHASCVMMKAAGTRLLVRAQDAAAARDDIDGADLFALVSALAWLNDQPALASRADRLFKVIAGAILVKPETLDVPPL
jgi:AcrR family transcriptional regulator